MCEGFIETKNNEHIVINRMHAVACDEASCGVGSQAKTSTANAGITPTPERRVAREFRIWQANGQLRHASR